jgi:hypothetical protein
MSKKMMTYFPLSKKYLKHSHLLSQTTTIPWQRWILGNILFHCEERMWKYCSYLKENELTEKTCKFYRKQISREVTGGWQSHYSLETWTLGKLHPF